MRVMAQSGGSLGWVTENFSPDELRQRALAYYAAVDGGELDALLDLALAGTATLTELQKAALEG